MSAEESITKKSDSSTSVEPKIDLGLERTILAADRTLMAWTRTAISLISFGFTIYKFLEFEYEGRSRAIPPEGPRHLGLAFITVGVLSLMLAALQNWWQMKLLCGPRGRGSFNLSLAVAISIILIGVYAFINVFSNSTS
jgi:inner membrane protein YidH